MRLCDEDRKRYWKIRQVRSAARCFNGHAEEGFVEWLGEGAGDIDEETRREVGSLFAKSAKRLGKSERKLDEALSERAAASYEDESAAREQKAANQALRGPVSSARQVVRGLTGGRQNLGLKGPTPRNSERLAGWGRILDAALPRSGVPDSALQVTAELAEKIKPGYEALESAVERRQLAEFRLIFANARLKGVRSEVDEEIGKVQEFLQAGLRMVGHEKFAERVLGKRRGRPRKSVRARNETEVAATPAPEARPIVEAVAEKAPEVRQEFDVAIPQTEEVGRKFDSEIEATALGAGTGLQETEEAPIKASASVEEIGEGPSETSAAARKIAEGPCKPCTALPKIGEGLGEGKEVVSFQEDTPKSRRRGRRRRASELLRVPKRWFSSGWMGRFVSRDPSQRKGGAGGGG